jgi:hypothetical protein
MPVPDFSPGEVLTAAAMDSIGLWKINSSTFTTQDPFDLTGIFSSTYRNYKIIMEIKGSATAACNMQMLSGTNTPYTLNNYYRYGFYVGGGGTFTGLSAANQTNMFITNTSTAHNSPIEMTIFAPNVSDRTYAMTQSFDPSSGLQIILHHQIDAATQFTGLRFDAASGSVTGNVRVYGFRD